MAIRPIYYDTETTGISSDNDRVVEIAFYDPWQDRTFLSFVKPDIPIPHTAAAIHGITNEMVIDAPTFDQVVPQLLEFCEGNTVLIAHNNDNFDLLFLQAEFKRAKLPFPSWTFIDSLKWARRYRPDLPKHSLQFLREIYAFASNQAHRALDDVIILSKVFEAMIGDLSMEIVLELLKAAASAPNPNKDAGGLFTKMPFGKHQGKLLSELPPHYLKWMHSSGLLDKTENEILKKSVIQLGLITV